MNRFSSRRAKSLPVVESRRMTIISAGIFLLFAFLAVRLAQLQIIHHEQYSVMAQAAHSQSQIIIPERGKILLQENYYESSENVYPVAINKDFALLFAVPIFIEDLEQTSEKLFTFFKEEDVKKEVEEILRRERFGGLDAKLLELGSLPEEEREAHEIRLRAEEEALWRDSTYLEIENLRREQLFEEKKAEELEKYRQNLDKPRSQFRMVERKISLDDLKRFYSFMLSDEDNYIEPEKFEIKSGRMTMEGFFDARKPLLPQFGFHLMPQRFYPELNLGSHILGFTSYDTDEQRGRYGLEGFFDNRLFGEYGSVSSERGSGRTVIVNNRQHLRKKDGDSLVLTIDRLAQANTCRMLNESRLRHGADNGSVIVVDPKTGAILVMCGSPDFDPNTYEKTKNIQVFNNPGVFNQYEPGSVFKAITMAAALDQEKVTPASTYVDHGQIMIPGWHRPIRNSDFAQKGGHGLVDMNKVLEQSLNTGAIYAMQQVGPAVFADYVKKFGFGEKTGIELQGEGEGNIKSITGKQVTEISAATASFGQGLTVTPLQMVMSYAVIANGGKLPKPYLVKEIISAEGERFITPIPEQPRVISERTAALLNGILVNVVEKGHSKRIQTPGYYIAGKTGTAQVASASTRGYSGHYDHTFIGIVPASDPKFVILTQFSKPRSAIYAESTVVPLAKEVTDFLINHWQIKPDRPLEN
ncbi:MAG: penicillin-binding protein 2 [Patescibacteria group bacterium]|nr:MAG: penicillin-binding protein 2 [Patescibacteria group bacterium]